MSKRSKVIEGAPPEPTKLGSAIDGALPVTWRFSNLDLAADLQADGSPLSLRALREIESLHADLQRTVRTLEDFDRRQRESKAQIAAAPRKSAMTKASLLSAVAAHADKARADGDEPLARGWKKIVAGRLGTRWSTLVKHLPAWGLTEPDIVVILQSK